MNNFKLQISNESYIINGKEIKKIFGGFGNNQPCLLAKQIAEIHGYELKRVNELINSNLDYLEEGIDYIDLKLLKNSDLSVAVLNDLGFSQEGINRSVSIYAFSRQGYALLCKFMRSEESKKVYKNVVREYFCIYFDYQNVL